MHFSYPQAKLGDDMCYAETLPSGAKMVVCDGLPWFQPFTENNDLKIPFFFKLYAILAMWKLLQLCSTVEAKSRLLAIDNLFNLVFFIQQTLCSTKNFKNHLFCIQSLKIFLWDLLNGPIPKNKCDLT